MLLLVSRQSVMFKKLVLSIVAANIFLLSTFVPSVNAASAPGPWYNQGIVEWYNKVHTSPPAEIFGERYTTAQVDWIIYSIILWVPTKLIKPPLTACFLQGLIEHALDVQNCLNLSAASTDVQLPTNYYAEKPKLENNQSLLSAVFEDRSLSGITYIKNVGRKFHLVPEAKAQQAGFGFTTALEPVQAFWRVSRNIAYLFFVFIIVIMAFMIMFRVKLSPQTVITVQSSLPKIALALILVTFSYAIAGFLVDIMYVVIGLLSVFWNQVLPGDINPVNIFNLLTKGQPFNVDFSFGITGLFILYLIFFMATLVIVIFTTFAGILGAIAGPIGFLAAILTGFAASFMLAGMGIILFFLAMIIVMWMAFKTMWMLIKAFVNIVLLTIVAPLQFTIGVLAPQFGFGAWLRSFISNLAVFVAVGFLLILSFVFLIEAVFAALEPYSQVAGSAAEFADFLFGERDASGWLSQTISAGWPPFLVSGSGPAAMIYIAISFVIFTLIPKTADMIKSATSGRPFAYGTGIGESFAPFAVGGLGAANLMSAMQRQKMADLARGDQVPSRLYKSIDALFNAVRGISGGRVK